MAGIAAVITAKNERDLLRPNVLYHRYLGIDRFFVFLDNTVDDSEDTLADFGDVEISPSIVPEGLREPESRWSAVNASAVLVRNLRSWHDNFVARQLLNTYVALERCRQAGYDWLIFIDADELICPDIRHASRGLLARILNQMDPAVQQVRFTPLEVIQRKSEYDNVFAEATLFKSPDSVRKRDLYDPFAARLKRFHVERRKHLPRIQRFSWWYGHRVGKSAVRIGAQAVPVSSHEFRGFDGKRLVSAPGGFLLHYVIYDSNDFLKKYRNFGDHPDTFVSGARVVYRKRFWRDLVNRPDATEDFLRGYFHQWIAFDDDWIRSMQTGKPRLGVLRRTSNIVEVTAVRDVFQELKAVSATVVDASRN